MAHKSITRICNLNVGTQTYTTQFYSLLLEYRTCSMIFSSFFSARKEKFIQAE